MVGPANCGWINNAKFSGHYLRPRTHTQRSCARTLLGPINNPLWYIYERQTLQLYHILELRRCVHDQRKYTVELELIKVRCNSNGFIQMDDAFYVEALSELIKIRYNFQNHSLRFWLIRSNPWKPFVLLFLFLRLSLFIRISKQKKDTSSSFKLIAEENWCLTYEMAPTGYKLKKYSNYKQDFQ